LSPCRLLWWARCHKIRLPSDPPPSLRWPPPSLPLRHQLLPNPHPRPNQAQPKPKPLWNIAPCAPSFSPPFFFQKKGHFIEHRRTYGNLQDFMELYGPLQTPLPEGAPHPTPRAQSGSTFMSSPDLYGPYGTLQNAWQSTGILRKFAQLSNDPPPTHTDTHTYA
jgi:hypothetical protein